MMKLNWRHKAGPFLTLVAVGCGLFLECCAKQAVGIALLGTAFAWLIGSVSPRTLMVTFAILICAVGLYVAVAPVWSDWNPVQNAAAQYDSAIADLQLAVKGSTKPIDYDALANQAGAISSTPPRGSSYHPIKVGSDSEIDLSAGLLPKPIRIVTIPDSAKNWIRPEERSDGIALHTFPEDVSDAQIVQAFAKYILLPRPTFSLGSSVRAHLWNVFGGLALFISGLSVLGWLFRRSMKQRSASLPLRSRSLSCTPPCTTPESGTARPTPSQIEIQPLWR